MTCSRRSLTNARARRRRRVRPSAALLTLSLVAAAGCGSNGSSSGDDIVPGRGSGAAVTPDLNPSGENPDEVEPYVGELLADYDRVVNEIIADPSVVEDDASPLVTEFLDLFEPDSEFAAEMVDLWRGMADEGRRTVSYSDDHPAGETVLDGRLTAVSAEEVSFPVCIVRRSRVLGPDDEELDGSLPRLDLPGEGVAVRTDNGWRLREVWAEDGGLTCRGDT